MANAVQLAQGKWRIDVYKKGMRKTFRGKSRPAVEKMAREWLNDIERYGTEIRKTSSTLDELMYDVLYTNIKISVRENGFERYMSCYNTHFKDKKFAKKNITTYSQKDLQKFINEYQEMSDTTIKIIYILLNKTFQFAQDNNLIRINPMKKVIKPKSTKEKRKIEAMTLEEQKFYMNACKNHKHGNLFMLALLTGMRQGELIALKWENVDMENKMIHVKHTSRVVRIWNNEGEFEDVNIIGTPKTSAGERVIPMDKTIKNIFNKQYLKSEDSEFVFCNKKGEQLKNSTVQKAHNKLLKDLGIRHLQFHALRHTFATRQVELGVDIRTLSELLGHADVSITLNRYCHSTLDSKINAMDKIGQLISTL